MNKDLKEQVLIELAYLFDKEIQWEGTKVVFIDKIKDDDGFRIPPRTMEPNDFIDIPSVLRDLKVVIDKWSV